MGVLKRSIELAIGMQQQADVKRKWCNKCFKVCFYPVCTQPVPSLYPACTQPVPWISTTCIKAYTICCNTRYFTSLHALCRGHLLVVPMTDFSVILVLLSGQPKFNTHSLAFICGRGRQLICAPKRKWQLIKISKHRHVYYDLLEALPCWISWCFYWSLALWLLMNSH